MKLEDQVCGLELAKKLKEIGVKQDSLQYWTDIGESISGHPSIYRQVEPHVTSMPSMEIAFAIDKKKNRSWVFRGISAPDNVLDGKLEDGELSVWSAFSVAELGEMLPDFIYQYKTSGQWAIWYVALEESSHPIYRNDTQANNLSRMLIWCIENGKVKP